MNRQTDRWSNRQRKAERDRDLSLGKQRMIKLLETKIEINVDPEIERDRCKKRLAERDSARLGYRKKGRQVVA